VAVPVVVNAANTWRLFTVKSDIFISRLCIFDHFMIIFLGLHALHSALLPSYYFIKPYADRFGSKFPQN